MQSCHVSHSYVLWHWELSSRKSIWDLRKFSCYLWFLFNQLIFPDLLQVRLSLPKCNFRISGAGFAGLMHFLSPSQHWNSAVAVKYTHCNYLHHGGYVIVVVCLSVCVYVSNFAQKLPNGFAWNFREGWQWASEQMIKMLVMVWSRICIRIQIQIATLVRRPWQRYALSQCFWYYKRSCYKEGFPDVSVW